MAYLPGDGVLNFEDSIRTVGELKSAIESALGLPTFKQVCAGCLDEAAKSFGPYCAHATGRRTTPGGEW